MTITIERWDAHEAERNLEVLCTILIDALEGGASISFVLPFEAPDAERFWRRIVEEVGRGTTVLLAARDASGTVQGTVQLDLATPPNQPHRADVRKLIVHRRARRAGIARKLMSAIETEARAHGRSLITLDTEAAGAAERLYEDLGYRRLGVIPDYATDALGEMRGATFFWKQLERAA